MSPVGGLLAVTPVWFVMFGAFLTNTQMNRAYVARDLVDAAAARAADAATKTLCDPTMGGDMGGAGGPRGQAIERAVRPLLEMIGPTGACKVAIVNASGGPVARLSGADDAVAEVSCDVPCTIPFAAKILCKGTPKVIRFSARQRFRPMTCDMKGGAP